MNDILAITDPGWDWGITSLMLIPVGILFLAGVFRTIHHNIRGWRRKDFFLSWSEGLTLVGVILGMVGGFGVVVWAGSVYENTVAERQVAGLESLGYSQVDLETKRGDSSYDIQFTASRGGDYFRGALVGDGDSRWQVVELEPSK